MAMTSDEELQQRYLQGKLSPEEEADYEAYFMDKPEIIEQLETQQAIRDGFRSAAPPFTATRGAHQRRRKSDRRVRHKWVPAFAIGAAAGVAAMVLVNLEPQLPQAIPNFPIVELGAVRSFGDQTTPVVTLGSDQTMIALKIQLQYAGAGPYSAEVCEVDTTEAVFKVKSLVPHVYGAVVLALPTSPLKPGTEYEVTVRSNETEPVERFRFELARKTP